MTHLIRFLSFNGNCREAMEFYRDCLAAELSVETIGESVLGKDLPESLKAYVFQAVLQKDMLRIVASDCAPDNGLFIGNAVSLYVILEDENTALKVFERLSFEGEILYPLISSFWNDLFGGLKDRFGNYWLISCNNR